MKSGVWLRRAVAVLAMAVLSAAGSRSLRAEDDTGAPGRAVRLSNVDGEVQIAQAGEVLADHALVNTPLFEGTQITTGSDGRAEIQFEDGSVVRIPPGSSLTLAVLRQDGQSEIVLDTGMAYFELQDASQGGAIRVRFDSNVVTPSGFTVLRVRLDQGPGDLAVFSGNAHLDATNGTAMDLHGGESVSLGDYNVAQSLEPDSWDAWNSDRDQALTTADVGNTEATENLPNSNSAAWGDLNSSGTWYDVPDQGYVWSPYEASNAGWDPYGSGYWMWTPNYGYVWVSGYHWGYLPYQCGAWNWYGGFGWGWAPGMCNTWWGSGGWAFNVGYIPTWYRLPNRPHFPRPRSPQPVSVGRTVNNLRPIGLRPRAPVIAVNRKEPSGVTALPPRAPNHPVQIGRVVAQPLRPTAPRASSGPVTNFNHVLPPAIRPGNEPPVQGVMPGAGSGQTGAVRPQPRPSRPGYEPTPGTGTMRPGYMPAPRPQPGTVTPPRTGSTGVPVYRPAPSTPRPAPSAPRPAPSAPSRPSAGGGYHPVPAPSVHSSGGGGGHPAASPR